jgi:hypothetical protein
MKAILYIGGALMVAASTYGLVDYKRSSHDKNFRNLYENKKEITMPGESKEPSAAKDEGVNATELKTQTEKTTKQEDVKKGELKASTTTDKKPVVKKKRKISAEKFSRAPLDEKYLEEKILPEPKNKEVKVKEL